MATLPVETGDRFIDTSEYEMVNGHLRKRPPMNDAHSILEDYCTDVLRLVARPLGMKVRHEWTIYLGKEWLTPDVTVAAPNYQRGKSGYIIVPPPPHLVIEILSPSQKPEELFDKGKEYHPYGVPFYWVIDPVKRGCYSVLMQQLDAAVRAWPVTDALATDALRMPLAPMWQYLDEELNS